MFIFMFLLCLLPGVTPEKCNTTTSATITVPSTTITTTVPPTTTTTTVPPTTTTTTVPPTTTTTTVPPTTTTTTVPPTTTTTTVPPTTTTTTLPPTTAIQGCSFPNCQSFNQEGIILFVGKENVISQENSTSICYPFEGTIFVPKTEDENRVWLEFTTTLYNENNSFSAAWYPMIYIYGNNSAFYWYSEEGTSEVSADDFKPPTDSDYDGQPNFNDFQFTEYDSEGTGFVSFVQEIRILPNNLEIRDSSKPAGYAICVANLKRRSTFGCNCQGIESDN